MKDKVPSIRRYILIRIFCRTTSLGMWAFFTGGLFLGYLAVWLYQQPNDRYVAAAIIVALQAANCLVLTIREMQGIYREAKADRRLLIQFKHID